MSWQQWNARNFRRSKLANKQTEIRFHHAHCKIWKRKYAIVQIKNLRKYGQTNFRIYQNFTQIVCTPSIKPKDKMCLENVYKSSLLLLPGIFAKGVSAQSDFIFFILSSLFFASCKVLNSSL
jgi:hypothetical protein